MALFRRRNAPPLESSGDAADDALLQQIAKRSDLTRPRHWLHYVYFAGEDGARAAAGEAKAAGWTLQTVDVAATGDGWVVIAEQHGVVLTPSRVAEARDFFQGLAARHAGGDYDGWEASL